MTVDGSVALVTGAGSGIGAAMARRMASEGARLIVTDIDTRAGLGVAESIEAPFLELDVTSSQSWQAVVRQARDRWGRIDIVCLNAGIMTGNESFADVSDAEFARAWAVNVAGVFYGARQVVPLMLELGSGHIVVTSSLAGVTEHSPDVVYTMTKHATIGLVRGLSTRLPTSIQVNAICPSTVDTPLVPDARRARYKRSGFQMLEPEEIADTLISVLGSTGTGAAWLCRPGHLPTPVPFPAIQIVPSAAAAARS